MILFRLMPLFTAGYADTPTTRKKERLIPSTKIHITFYPAILFPVFFPSLYAFLSIE